MKSNPSQNQSQYTENFDPNTQGDQEILYAHKREKSAKQISNQQAREKVRVDCQAMTLDKFLNPDRHTN